MANLGFSGAETGDVSEFDTQSGISIDSTLKKTGTFSYILDSGGDNGEINITAVDEPRAGLWWRTTDVTDDMGICGFRFGGSPLGNCRVSTNSKLEARIQGGTTVEGSTTLVNDTWYFLEFRWKKGTGSDAEFEVRINGIVEALANDGTQTLQANLFFINGPSRTVAIANIDDIRIRDDAYPGEGFVSGLRPDATGDEDNFTPGGSTGVTNTSDDSDATLQTAPGSGSIPFLHNVDALTLTTIDRVDVKVRAQRTNGSGRTHFIRWKKPGGTAENSADIVLGSGGFALFSFTPSDQPTTQAHIDDMQCGMSQSAAGGRLAECAELYIMVDYTVAGSTPLTLEVADDLDNLADGFSKALAINLTQSFSETIDNLDDAVLKTFEYRKILEDDTLNLADDIVKRLSYELTKGDDLLNLADAIRNVYGREYLFGDDLDNWLDAVVKALGEVSADLTLNLSDDLNNLVDSILLNLEYRKILADNMLGLADSEIITLGYEIQKEDSINNLVDAIKLRYSYRLLPTDSINNLSDAASIRQSYEILKGDSLSNWLEEVSKTLEYRILSVDILTQSDNISKRLGYLISKADTINNLSDDAIVRRLHQYEVSAGELCLLTDSFDGADLNIPVDDEQQIVIRLLI